MSTTLQLAWVQFKAERAVTLCPTSLTADYKQVEKWINRCPITNLEEGRQVMTWVLGQKPIKSSRRVAMYVKSLYKWAASEDIALLTKNPITTFKMPKPPQEDIDVIVIPQKETSIVLLNKVYVQAIGSSEIAPSVFPPIIAKTIAGNENRKNVG